MLPELDELARRRKKLGLTQSELSERVSVSRSLIAKLETGRLVPSYRVGKRLFDELERLEVERKGGDLLRNVTVGEIHGAPIEYVQALTPIQEVWIRMVETNFSQFPIRDGETISGSITERGINRAIMERDPEEVRSLPVREIMEPAFPTVSSRTAVGAVMPLLKAEQAVMTVEEGDIIGIITNSDIGKVFRLIEQR